MEISREHYRNNRTADPALTELGHAQAQATADYLSSKQNSLIHEFDDIYVSPCKRTLQTANPIIAAIKVKGNGGKAKVWTDIYEIGGVHEQGIGKGGLSRNEMSNLCSGLFDIPNSVSLDGWYTHGVHESHNLAKKRVRRVVNKLKFWAQECGKGTYFDRHLIRTP